MNLTQFPWIWNWHGLEEIGTLHQICDFWFVIVINQ